ncbi:MAG: FAD-dependent monooxygenase [Nitrospirales bacterium]|nr:FAD-dependent monooxygenase [Nitrospira sp.]MDR4502434.1 FAD-dependent monooxygenase [Nitrospirales bacterium]
MDLQKDVVIVGAGGGGAILATKLARKHISATVLEQSSGPPQGLRGEILQPNGQRILDEMGLLAQLPSHAIRPVRYFHFRRVGGERLCTVDYGTLPQPYNRALVMWPNSVQQTVLANLEKESPKTLQYGVKVKRLLREGTCICGVEAELDGKTVRIGAKLVVGADGPFSMVRDALGIPTRLHRYQESYLVAMLDGHESLGESQYFVGKKTILGIFPAAGNKMYVFYMIPSGALADMKKEGTRALSECWTNIYPELGKTFETLTDWSQTAYMGTGRVKAKTWVAEGAVLIGDAAHGMNPHASQGRMQAMVDADILSEVIQTCAEKDDWSVSRVREFERRRRPQVTMLQRLADEEVFFWNTGNPVLSYLRDRVFMTIDNNPRLKYQVLSATAGLRESPPFSFFDRIKAAGIIPDSQARQAFGQK